MTYIPFVLLLILLHTCNNIHTLLVCIYFSSSARVTFSSVTVLCERSDNVVRIVVSLTLG